MHVSEVGVSIYSHQDINENFFEPYERKMLGNRVEKIKNVKIIV